MHCPEAVVDSTADESFADAPDGRPAFWSSRPIRVRPFEAGDAQPFFDAVHESIDTVGQWLPWCHAGYTMEEAATWMTSCQNFWRDGLAFNFAVVDDETGAFLGSVGIDRIDHEHRNANIGYWVRSSCAGQGVISTAVELLLPFAFGELHLLRLEVVVLLENRASQRVAEKIGAQFECVARNRLMLWNHPLDAVVYSLLAEDARQHLSPPEPSPVEGAGVERPETATL
jgi:RimJ/RimL family protein N-acetyltransferase